MSAAAGLVRLGIRVRREAAESAWAALEPLLAAGAEESVVAEDVEYAIYLAECDAPSEADVRALAGDAVLAVSRAPVAHDWATRWHDFLPPVTVGALRVRAPWHDARDGDLVIEPGAAFGAGTHPTTRLCLELLDEEEPGARSFADWGCGTGVLAILAARRGFAPVVAVDLDPAAVDLTARNAAANEAEVHATSLDLLAGPAPSADVIYANLPIAVWRGLGPLGDVRRLVVSGVLAAHADEVVGRLGLREAAPRRTLEGWAALVLEAA
jgi:ribosomal protein L11 methyltransferase